MINFFSDAAQTYFVIKATTINGSTAIYTRSFYDKVKDLEKAIL